MEGSWLDSQPFGNCSIEIGNRGHILARIARNLHLIVAGLEAATFGIEPPPHDRSQDHSDRLTMFLFKRQDRDHPVTRITQAGIGRPISDQARFVYVRLVGQNDRCDPATGSGEGSSIDINEVDSMIFTVDWLSQARYCMNAPGQDKNLGSTQIHDWRR